MFALMWHTGWAAGQSLPHGNITVDSDGATVDGRSNLLVLPNVRIAQDGYQISASEARATGLNFENSQWTFNGKVEFITPSGASHAEHATVTFVDNQIVTVHISGEPATFQQTDSNQQTLAEGHAQQIDYELAENTVRMRGQAWIKYGQNEVNSAVVVYDILNRRVQANREDQQGERVRITIRPNNPNSGDASSATP